MRILVLSDSHGHLERMLRCVELAEPQHILFLGDGLGDYRALRLRYPDIPMDAVAGNCDLASTEPVERLVELGGKRILMLHGHTRSVRCSLMNACYAAREQGADVLLYGHTHQAMVDFDGSLYVMNPGSMGDNGSYGIITILPEKLDCTVFRI